MNIRKVGILGGGQLGRMLIQSGIDFNIPFSVMDPDSNAPCARLADFQQGSLLSYDDVMRFGKACDLITIEIEHVNTKALKDLQSEGKKVFPQPDLIEMIQDKRKQKAFYATHDIPTAEFVLVENADEIRRRKDFFPSVNKLAKEGYDGRGVKLIRQESDWNEVFDAPGLLEKLIEFEKEIAIIGVRSEGGEITTYPPVEMVFNKQYNLVEYLYSPARVSAEITAAAEEIVRRLLQEMQIVGLLAVEMFVTASGDVLVNEIAPRPHNSGHHTIEGNVTSQFEQHLRAILNMPLGDTRITAPSAMVNLLGSEGHTGDAKYEGLQEALKLPGVHVHLYGKLKTKPFRKMGHITIVNHDTTLLADYIKRINTSVKVIAG